MSKGENMVGRCAETLIRWMDAFATIGHGEAFPPAPSTAAWVDYAKVEQAAARLAVRAVIEALIEEPASGALLARVEAVARSLNPLRSEDHIKSVALDSLSIHRAILRAALDETSKSVG